jgi:hypothetical protein
MHKIYLSRYSTYEARKLITILDNANSLIKQYILKAKSVDTKAHYKIISREIRRIMNEAAEALDGQLELDFIDLAEEEIRFVEKTLSPLTDKAEFTLPSPKQVWAAASFGPYTGPDGKFTFRNYIKSLGNDAFNVWDIACRSAYLTGTPAKSIVKSVLGAVNTDGWEPGRVQKLRNSLEMNARTMISSMAETARDSVYKENESLFDYYIRLETLDSRTCVACGAEDLKRYPNLESAPKLPIHLGCRGLYLPHVKGMPEYLDGDERASVDGPVPAKMTYQDWLAQQDPAIQKEILGPARYAAYKNGMPITSFSENGTILTLPQIMKKEGLEFFGGGLATGSWQAQKAYANTYYESIRNRKNPTDVERIAEHTGFSRDEISSIRRHVFTDEHDLGDGDYGRFASNWRMAQAWQRMEQGWDGNGMAKYKDYDVLLLNHEFEELTQMAKYGYNTIEAHEKAESKYPWDVKIKELD